MDTMRAFAMSMANKDKPPMVFDWDAAAKKIKESGVQEASAGLRSDWEWTGGRIFEDGKPLARRDTYTFLASTWATPELRLGYEDKVPCFIMRDASPGWYSDTYWPLSALRILFDEDEEKVFSEYKRIHA